MVRIILGQPKASFEIAAEASGKPVVTGHPEIFISISHSQASLACAATQIGPIGIDLEIARPHRDLAGIAAFAFGPREQIRIAQEGADGFYRIWTLREAIAKANGIGLIEAADRRDRVESGPVTGDWRWQDWHLTHRILAPGRHLAIAVHAPAVEIIDWRRVTPNGA
ncbi:MAG: 4'-phosphopantetheinyl transferase superfamily protein [Proteobacteria bacterium]|nr:4'-phosphopantetheinyl transferase superfamily protein [Pseudomonadota bacterium]